MQQKNWAELFTGINAPNVINRDSDLSNQGMTQNMYHSSSNIFFLKM